MKGAPYKIIKLRKGDKIPFDLLLLADETKAAIEKYVHHSDIYILHKANRLKPIGVFVLLAITPSTIEIKNMAVSENLQGKGIGSFLIDKIKTIARSNGYKNIIVGTPDCASGQINFYEKNGFSKYGVRKNFFIDNYAVPIIENGIMLKDMLLLQMKLY